MTAAHATPGPPPGASVYLATQVAGRRERRYALFTLVLTALVFVAVLPFGRTPLAQLPAFIPIYVTALVICDLVTAVLLFGHYRALRTRALLVLAAAYTFTAFAVAAYALIFPGLFAPTGLLGSGPQTSSALYMFWHAGFPLLAIVYALQPDHLADTVPALGPGAPRAWLRVCGVLLGLLVVVAAFTALATAGHGLLPTFLDGNRTTVAGRTFLVGIWLLSALALGVLWRRRPHTVIDVWLLIVLVVWLCDIALAAVLNTGRYDLGWYAGRIYGLFAACALLIALLTENARHYAQLVRLSAQLRTANDLLWRLSSQDGLTELANRRSFDQYLADQAATARRHQRPLALVLIDVDHFKAYNDHQGHQAGDRCLQRVGEVLEANAHRASDMAARYGGEEFALVLPDTDTAGAAHIAEQARRAIEALDIAHPRSSAASHVTVSCGVAARHIAADASHASAALIAAADAALYEAKAAGRNRVVVATPQPA